MKDSERTGQQLLEEVAALRQRVAVLEDTDLKRRRAEEELVKSKAILTAAIECLPFDFFALDPDGRCILQNALSRQYYGEALGKTAEQVCPDGRILPRWIEGSRRALGGEKVEGEEAWRVGGEQREFYNVLAPIQHGGTLYGVLGVNVDITDRKQTERELAKHRVMLQATIDSLPFNFFAMGLDGRYMLQNAVSKAQHRADVVGRRPEEVCPNEHDLAIWLDNNRRAFAGEKVEGEVTLSLTGEERFYHNVIVPISGGTEFYGILGVNIDITERKRAEEALQKAHDELEEKVRQRTAELSQANEHLKREVQERELAEEALRQSERRFRNYFEQGLIGMAVTSVDKRWLEVNDRLCEILGYRREELVQTNWAALTHPDDIEPNRRLFDPLLAGEIERFTLNKRYLKKDGSIVHVTIHTRAFRKQDGTVDHIVTLIEDITARKHAEEALERERQSLWRMLQASDHERQTIAYDIHDGLAQCLAAAGMQLQVFDELRDSDPEAAKKAYDAAAQLVRQSHAETRRLISEVRPPVIDEIGLETAISHLVHEQRRRGGPNIECHSDVQFGRLPPILENAIYRIVQEALTNACKHSKSKKVTVTMAQQGQGVCLEVRDWGIGFDPQAVEKGHFGLEGIRQRARLLGGRLTIESTSGSGTLVQVVVPIVERQNEA